MKHFEAVLTKSFFRSPSTHKMSPWVRKIFLQFMPRLLIMRRTTYTLPEYDDTMPPHGYQNEMEMQLVST